MKLILTTILIITLALASFAQTVVQGRASYRNGMAMSNVIVTVYNMNGLPVASARTSSFGYYYMSVRQHCCATYVVIASARTTFFSPPAFVMQTQFDDGHGFVYNFVAIR